MSMRDDHGTAPAPAGAVSVSGAGGDAVAVATLADIGFEAPGALLSRHGLALVQVADQHEDVTTASLIENWIDETEKRVWFLFEAGRAAGNSGH